MGCRRPCWACTCLLTPPPPPWALCFPIVAPETEVSLGPLPLHFTLAPGPHQWCLLATDISTPLSAAQSSRALMGLFPECLMRGAPYLQHVPCPPNSCPNIQSSQALRPRLPASHAHCTSVRPPPIAPKGLWSSQRIPSWLHVSILVPHPKLHIA